MVDHVLKCLAPIEAIDHVYVVTNEKFAGHFEEWAKNRDTSEFSSPVTVVNDHSTDDTNKLGAIGDLHLVLKSQNVEDDVMVVAGDNLFSEGLGDYGRICSETNAPVLGVYDVGSLEEATKYGVVEPNDDGHIVSADHERWFDRDKLEVHYGKQGEWLRNKGFTIDARWFPR